MIRKIIKIDEEKCNGCGACAAACHEGAIEMINGKARLVREDYCDGLGDCLPACPVDAITFEEREAKAYDEAAVAAAKATAVKHAAAKATAVKDAAVKAKNSSPLPCGCPGTASRVIKRDACAMSGDTTASKGITPSDGVAAYGADAPSVGTVPKSQLSQWPVQIKLVPVNAPYFDGAKLLIAADCTAYAYGSFHRDFIRNHITLIGCPKLDEGDYADKLTAILKNNDVKSVTVVRMEVPCCGGIENAVKRALQASGKLIPWQVVTVTTDGRLLD